MLYSKQSIYLIQKIQKIIKKDETYQQQINLLIRIQILFSMNSSKKTLAVLSLVFLISLLIYMDSSPQELTTKQQRLLITTYTTNSTRTNSVNTFCAGKNRKNLTNSAEISAYSFFNQQMGSMLNIDGNMLISNFLNGNLGQVTSTLQSNVVQAAAFIGPFILGLVLIIFMSPCFLCCCICPEKCPSKCCRKNEQEQYTNCELYWPTVVLILALLLCIGACIAGFTQSQQITADMDSMSCSVAIVLDDLIHGNITNDGSSFFAGLTQIQTQLGYLKGNLTIINNTMATLIPSSTNMTNVNTAATNALQYVAQIPANVNAGGNMNTITYKTPFNSASTTGTITSIFPPILGSSTTGGYVGALYTLITSAKSTVTGISTSASNFNSQAANFQASVTPLQGVINSFTSFLTTTDGNSYDFLNNYVAGNKSLISMGVQLVFGVTIGLASLMLLGTLMVAFCDKARCRYLIYLSCFLLFFVGVGGFILSVLFSVVTPTVFFGCQFINFSLSSSSNFNSNFQNIITNSSQLNYISTCLPSSSGNIISAFGGNAVSAITNLSNSVTNINSFNITYTSSMILSAMSQITSYLTNYNTGVILDFVDSSSFTILNNLSNSTAYSGCTSPGFTSDSWVPSNSQNPVYIACKIPSGNITVAASCTGTNFNTRAGSCNGCMDTALVLNSYTAKATLLSNLNTRYPAAGCSTFNNDLANTWFNYYYNKSQSYAPVIARANTANGYVNTYVTSLTGTLNTTLQNAITALNGVAATVTDPTYGLMAGLNCRLIGQDIQTATNTFCQSVFTISYYMRLVMGLASFGILFSLCCGVCTGVRFYKHGIRKLNGIDNTGLSDGEVQDVTNTNFVKPKILQ